MPPYSSRDVLRVKHQGFSIGKSIHFFLGGGGGLGACPLPQKSLINFVKNDT